MAQNKLGHRLIDTCAHAGYVVGPGSCVSLPTPREPRPLADWSSSLATTGQQVLVSGNLRSSLTDMALVSCLDRSFCVPGEAIFARLPRCIRPCQAASGAALLNGYLASLLGRKDT